MKIKLLHGKTATIDNKDGDRVQQYQWYARKCRTNEYVYATINHKLVLLHRFILGLKQGDGKIVDHINHNGLDNRRRNLRLVTPAENVRHRRVPAKHIYWEKSTEKWVARIWIGSFNTALGAKRAYNKAYRKLTGEE